MARASHNPHSPVGYYGKTIANERNHMTTNRTTPNGIDRRGFLKLMAAGAATMPLGIVTSRDALEMGRFFSQYDLPSRFGTIVIADDTPLRCKPLPDPLLLYCERTGTSPRDCIYIGDAPGDAEAARSAGMDFALVDFSASHALCAEDVSLFQSPAALKRYLLDA